MIGQLIKITSVPIKLQYNSEPARLDMKSQPKIPFAQVTTTPPTLKINTENTSVKIDTYQARRSLGQYNIRDFAAMQAQQGRQQALNATGQAAQLGWQISDNYDNGVTIGQLVRQRMNQQPQMVMKFLPQGGAQLSWKPAQCNIDYQMGNTDYQYQWPDMQYDYTPAKMDVTVVQYPEVNVEYLGTPNYVPPSADPEYEEPV